MKGTAGLLCSRLCVQAYRDNGRLAVEDADLAQSIWDSGLGSLLVKLLQVSIISTQRAGALVLLLKACLFNSRSCHTHNEIDISSGQVIMTATLATKSHNAQRHHCR